MPELEPPEIGLSPRLSVELLGKGVSARPPWSVGVVIPARNEASTIERCIASIVASCSHADLCASACVVVVADRCSDESADLARRQLGDRGTVLECSAGSPGTARRFGVGAVLEHFAAVNPRTVWLANTDADGYVPVDWIGTQLLLADADVDAVAGIVELDPDGLRADIGALYERTYFVTADGSHGHVHGANFGVRADAYLAAGGWSDLAVAEDHCLWGRLARRGSRLHSTAASVVRTSARLHGRAMGGFADTLRRELACGE